MSEVFDTLSVLVAKKKLVPFMGPGCSAAFMHNMDRVINHIAKELGIDKESNNLEVIQKYINTFGKENFCKVLRKKLNIDEFDDRKGYIYLLVMHMGASVIYTTNQDNIMEKACEKYKRKIRTIINLEDFGEIELSELPYIKFHGDFNYPDTIVFTDDDYKKRMNDTQNALNIRLRADLLAKNLLFIGYSFTDINIQQMFSELQEVFQGQLPKSYMIAYEYSDKLQSLCDKYNIELINPMNEFSEIKNNAEAFRYFLSCLMTESENKRRHKEIRKLSIKNTKPKNYLICDLYGFNNLVLNKNEKNEINNEIIKSIFIDKNLESMFIELQDNITYTEHEQEIKTYLYHICFNLIIKTEVCYNKPVYLIREIYENNKPIIFKDYLRFRESLEFTRNFDAESIYNKIIKSPTSIKDNFMKYERIFKTLHNTNNIAQFMSLYQFLMELLKKHNNEKIISQTLVIIYMKKHRHKYKFLSFEKTRRIGKNYKEDCFTYLRNEIGHCEESNDLNLYKELGSKITQQLIKNLIIVINDVIMDS